MITRDAVIEFIEEHRMQVLAGAAAVLVACMIALIVMISSSRARDAQRQKKTDEMKLMALDADSLFMGGEPIGVSGVLLSRERKAAWSAEDAKRWYTVPDASSMDRLRSAGSDRIDALLESVP